MTLFRIPGDSDYSIVNSQVTKSLILVIMTSNEVLGE